MKNNENKQKEAGIGGPFFKKRKRDRELLGVDRK